MLKYCTVLKVFAILSVGVALSIGCVYSISRQEEGVSGFTIISFLLSFVIPVILALYALIVSLKAQTKLHGLMILLLSYISLIFSFASAYYAISWNGDMNDATEQYYYYNDLREIWQKEKPDPAYRTESSRAFKGMEARLLSGIEELARPLNYQQDAKNAPVREIMRLTAYYDSKSPRYKYGIKYHAEAKWEVFLDCIHYSIVTMATVGYGDIVPQSRLAKGMTDIQIISGQVLFLFALGIVFGKSTG